MDGSSFAMACRAAVRWAALSLRRCGAGAVVACALAASAVAAPEQQRHFASAEEAAQAFGDAVMTSDEEALRAIFGPDLRRYIPPLGQEITLRFLEAWAKAHRVVPGEGKALLEVGTDGWTLPIPIVEDSAGWRFDMEAGAEEMRVRRIGRNENAAREVVLAIFDAEREYASRDADGDGLLEYAPKIASAPGKKDGLFWATAPGEESSPLGELVAKARAEGGARGSGYHGYRYRILTAQGPHAPGGAFDYRVRGKMIGGFAIIAWPVQYGETGVMTFMVNHDGVVYEKDLGPQTEARVRAVQRFDPDSSWRAEKGSS